MGFCGWCYEHLEPGEGQVVKCGEGLYVSVVVCLDERSCWERQRWREIEEGHAPRRRMSFLVIRARTPEGEEVL